MPALLSVFGNMFTGASGAQGTSAVMQLTQAAQAAEAAAARQRTMIYVGGGLLAALAVGGVIYYVVR
ncbi:MAG: hypothetical protein WC700_18265 [Gemmatimonadaceae bacterium]|jgi:predicted lipid-binding transport protein (Tim44 family)